MSDPAVPYPTGDAVHRINTCVLKASASHWPFARDAAAAIDANWQDATQRNPNYFNGSVYLIERLAITDGALEATLLRSDFKSYLHWRQLGYPYRGVRDGFGSALIRAADGAYLLGRQRAGNINAGLSYLPGGFIDDRDVAGDGGIDIAASIARELYEETGLDAPDVIAMPGFLVTEAGAQLSIAKTFQSPLDSGALKAQIEQHFASDAHSELDGMVIVARTSDLDRLPMPDYARVLLRNLLSDAPASA